MENAEAEAHVGGACPSPAPLSPALSAQSERGRLGVVAASGTAPQLLAAASVLQFPLPLPLPLLLSLPPLLLRSNCGTCSCGSTTAGFCHVTGFAGCRSACSASSPSPPTLGSRTALYSWLLPAESSLLALVVLRVLRQAVAGLLCSHYPGRAPCAVASRGPSVVGWCWLRGGASASPPLLRPSRAHHRHCCCRSRRQAAAATHRSLRATGLHTQPLAVWIRWRNRIYPLESVIASSRA